MALWSSFPASSRPWIARSRFSVGSPGEQIDLPYGWGEPVKVHYRETDREYQLRK